MKQLELAKRYFEEYGRPMIERQFPQLKDSYAAGLAGEGSGCLGYDDEISQDHDLPPGFASGCRMKTLISSEQSFRLPMTDCPKNSWGSAEKT